jgi:hypothetical protein
MFDAVMAADLPCRSIVSAQAERAGIGMRVDCDLPFGGILRLVHWLVSPFASAPDGIVEEPGSLPATRIACFTPDMLQLDWVFLPTPTDRLVRRNLVSADRAFLLGVRCWDIPHDRHAVLSDLATGRGVLAPAPLPGEWHRLTGVQVAGQSLMAQ